MPTELEKCIVGVYAVYEIHDEYANRKTLRKICRTKHESEIASVGLGWYGGPGYVEKKMAIIDPETGSVYLLVSSSAWEFEDVAKRKEEMKQRAKEAALAKLTPEERKLLGL